MRTKARVEHRVPRSRRAIDNLRELESEREKPRATTVREVSSFSGELSVTALVHTNQNRARTRLPSWRYAGKAAGIDGEFRKSAPRIVVAGTI